MSEDLFKEKKAQIAEIIKRYPTKESAAMAILYIAQKEFGYLSPEVIRNIAKEIGVQDSSLLGVVSFYTMYHRQPKGRYHIQVCTNLSCSLLGAEHLLSYLQKRLKIRVGEVTQDGLFSLEEVQCLASCGTAPVVQINEDYYENLTQERLEEILLMLQRRQDGKGSY
jgi:NADH-quinone oxidoreductase E subunit